MSIINKVIFRIIAEANQIQLLHVKYKLQNDIILFRFIGT